MTTDDNARAKRQSDINRRGVLHGLGMDRVDEILADVWRDVQRERRLCKAHACGMPANQTGYCADHAYLATPIEPPLTDEDTQPITVDAREDADQGTVDRVKAWLRRTE